MLPVKRRRVESFRCGVPVSDNICVFTVHTAFTEPLTPDLMRAVYQARRHLFEVADNSIAGTPCACGGACCGCCVFNPQLVNTVVDTYVRTAGQTVFYK
uniref:MC020L n=1 Tax=Rousettus bat poxvirus TaxID=3141933 RepID=A0AAU7E187_9POXV